MRSLNRQSAIPWDVLLAGPQSGGGVVHPVALRLVDLPLIRAVQKLERLQGPDARLPVHAYTARLRGRRPDGSSYDVVVKGDDRHGLPYGSDGDILFALFKIADGLPEPARSELMNTGRFRDPTVGMIARAMGRPVNGETTHRIREALHRLSHLRIEMHVTEAAEDLGMMLLSQSVDITEPGDGVRIHPAEPDGSPVPKAQKGTDTVGVLSVLEYSVSRTYNRRREGEDWISHLQINPLWLREMAAGWTAWINVEHYVALRAPIAKRLYQLFAGEAARGVATPWVYGLSDLQERCGMVGTSRRPAAVRDSIDEAARELIDWEILSAVECAKVGHGRYAFSFEPGVQLRLASLLRGVGALDVRELRMQRMLLRYFGVTREQADRILAERPSRVHEALQYLLYVRDTDHTRVKRSWSAYLLKLVDGDANFAGDVRYQMWLGRQRRQALPRSAAHESEQRGIVTDRPDSAQSGAQTLADEPRLVADAAAPRRIPAIDAARTVARSAEAVQMWAQVRDRAAARYPRTHRVYVEDLAPYDLAGSTLTCISATEFTLRKLESIGVRPIEEELIAASHGTVSRVCIEVFQEARHARSAASLPLLSS